MPFTLMKHLVFSIATFFLLISVFAQPFHLGVFGGISNYQGDIEKQFFFSKFTKPAIGFTINYELTDKWIIRGGYLFSRLGADDNYNSKTDVRLRNLNFETKLSDFSLIAQYHFYSLDAAKWIPYAAGGIAIYKFNPYTYDVNNQKVYLQPLSTEGQGLSNYPGTKPYKLTQLAFPIGGGFTYIMSERINVSFELIARKLVTDYLDDVSAKYADENDLLAERGPLAVELSYRGDELPGGEPLYPAKGEQRGNKAVDLYYFTGIHLTFRLGGGGNSSPKSIKHSRRYGCPRIPI